MDRQKSESLLGREITVKEKKYKLAEPLGGGLTSEVYRGDPFEEVGESVAVKIARPDLSEDLKQSFKKEQKVLKELDEYSREARYFPEVLAFEEACDISGVGRRMVLVQELIGQEFIPLSDLKLEYDELRLPEPLALIIGSHYLRALEIVHEAGYACRDRKLRDVRWKWGEGCRARDIRSWLDADSPGELRILDWNVVGGRAEQPDDLLQFGEFWFELLLGHKPSMRKIGEDWWPIGCLEEQPGWDEISVGVQDLLKASLYPTRSNLEGLKEKTKTLGGIWSGIQENPSDLTEDINKVDIVYQAFSRYGLLDQMSDQERDDIKGKRDELKRRRDQANEEKFVEIKRLLQNGQFDDARSKIDELPEDEPWQRWQKAYWKVLAEVGSEKVFNREDVEKLINLYPNTSSLEDLELASSVFDTNTESSMASQSLEWLLKLLKNIRLAQQAKGEGKYSEAVKRAREAKKLWIGPHSDTLKGPLQYVLEVDPSDLHKEYKEAQDESEAEGQAIAELQEGITNANSNIFSGARQAFKEGLRTTSKLLDQAEQSGESESPVVLRKCFYEAMRITAYWQRYHTEGEGPADGQAVESLGEDSIQLPRDTKAKSSPEPASLSLRILYLSEWKRSCEEEDASVLRKFQKEHSFDEMEQFLNAWQGEQDQLRTDVLGLLPLWPEQDEQTTQDAPVINEQEEAPELPPGDWTVLRYYRGSFSDDEEFEEKIQDAIDRCLDLEPVKSILGQEEIKNPAEEQAQAPAQGLELDDLLEKLQEAQAWARLARRMEKVLAIDPSGNSQAEPQSATLRMEQTTKVSEDTAASRYDKITWQVESTQGWKKKWDELCSKVRSCSSDYEKLEKVVKQAESAGWNYIVSKDFTVDFLNDWSQAMRDCQSKLEDCKTKFKSFKESLDNNSDEWSIDNEGLANAVQEFRKSLRSIPKLCTSSDDDVCKNARGQKLPSPAQSHCSETPQYDLRAPDARGGKGCDLGESRCVTFLSMRQNMEQARGSLKESYQEFLGDIRDEMQEELCNAKNEIDDKISVLDLSDSLGITSFRQLLQDIEERYEEGKKALGRGKAVCLFIRSWDEDEVLEASKFQAELEEIEKRFDRFFIQLQRQGLEAMFDFYKNLAETPQVSGKQKIDIYSRQRCISVVYRELEEINYE
jgi:hypothetical protein